MDLLHQFLNIFHSEGIRALIEAYGLWLVCLIVFAESGAFPMLPGDSLLVICGIYAATPGSGGQSVLSLAMLLVAVPLCGILGGQIGYGVGRWAGPSVHHWKDRSLGPLPLYRHAWVQQTDAFFKRWGAFAVVAGRWVPFVRTFAPILAGVAAMPFGTYLSFNVIGAFSWVWSMVLVGYYLPPVWARVLPAYRLEDNIEKIILVIIFLSVLPIIYTYWKERGLSKAPAKASGRAKSKAKPAKKKRP